MIYQVTIKDRYNSLFSPRRPDALLIIEMEDGLSTSKENMFWRALENDLRMIFGGDAVVQMNFDWPEISHRYKPSIYSLPFAKIARTVEVIVGKIKKK